MKDIEQSLETESRDSEESPGKKGFFRRVLSFPGWWWRGYSSAGKSALCLNEHRRLFALTKSRIQNITRHFQALHRSRGFDVEGAPNMQDFNQVLEHWGIERHQLPKVIRVMRAEVRLFVGMGLLAVVGGVSALRYQVPIGIFSAMLIVIMSSTVVICRSWRVQVLCQERFVSFRDWVLGRDEQTL